MTIENLYNLFQQHPFVCTDSREITFDCIFFALKGLNFDGNKFAEESIKKGAKYAVVDNPVYAVNERIILVDNVLTTLQELALYHRKKLTIPIIAITGTNGKTTTKELLKIILSSKYNTLATKGNLNNHIGVPLTLLSIKGETEICIVEMGANHIGEIDSLCKIALPDYGLITNIGKAHIEGFGSFDGVLRAKTELYSHLSEQNGVIFCNAENPILVSQCGKTNCKTVCYGTKTEEFDAEIIENNPFLSLQVTDNNHAVNIQTNLIGNYNFENILAAICIGKYFGIEIEISAKQISLYVPNNMRSQWLKTNTNEIIVDTYNANPTSMALALENFNSLKKNNKIIILGDMLELGKDEEYEHKMIIEKLKDLDVIKIILVGKRFKKSNREKDMHCFENVDELINSNVMKTITNSTILIKGSRGMSLEKSLNYL